jgi:hypothetical protein
LRERPNLSDAERLAWLNEAVLVKSGLSPKRHPSKKRPLLNGWQTHMSAMAGRVAGERGISVADAWFETAEAIAASVPDPADRLYGIGLAVRAHVCGLVYDDPEKYAELLRLFVMMFQRTSRYSFAGDAGVSERRTAEMTCLFIKERLAEVRKALRKLPSVSGRVPPNSLEPSLIALGNRLMWDDIALSQIFLRRDGMNQMTNAELRSYVDFGEYHLWTVCRTAELGIEFAELSRFVGEFLPVWFQIVFDLECRQLLGPGVLSAYSDSVGNFEETFRRGPELVAAYHSQETNMTLTEYFDCCLAPVELNA